MSISRSGLELERRQDKRARELESLHEMQFQRLRRMLIAIIVILCALVGTSISTIMSIGQLQSAAQPSVSDAKHQTH